MSKYFALPILATVLALVGVRLTAASAPAAEPSAIAFTLPPQEPEIPAQEPPPAPAPVQKKEEPVPPPPAPAPAKPEPIIIILEPLPAPAPAPPPRPDVVVPPVVVTQTTIVNNTVNNYYPVVEPPPAPEPRQDVIETVPVAVFVCPTHHRANCCLPAPPKRVIRQPDTIFKTIPFQPPTPRGPRFNP